MRQREDEKCCVKGKSNSLTVVLRLNEAEFKAHFNLKTTNLFVQNPLSSFLNMERINATSIRNLSVVRMPGEGGMHNLFQSPLNVWYCCSESPLLHSSRLPLILAQSWSNRALNQKTQISKYNISERNL